jgi:hypothetical protein
VEKHAIVIAYISISPGNSAGSRFLGDYFSLENTVTEFLILGSRCVEI